MMVLCFVSIGYVVHSLLTPGTAKSKYPSLVVICLEVMLVRFCSLFGFSSGSAANDLLIYWFHWEQVGSSVRAGYL